MCILCKTGPLIYAEIGMTVLSVRKHLLFFREILTSQSIHNTYQASEKQNNNNHYYMANPVLAKSLCFDWFFLGQDFAVWTVSMETVQSVYFRFGAKPANSTFATKTEKKKCENCHSSHWKYQQKLKRFKFFRNFKDGWRRRTILKWKPPEVHFTIRNTVPYNKLLTNRACSGRTGAHWPSVVFFLSRPRANIPQYGPRARLVRGYYFHIIYKLFKNIYCTERQIYCTLKRTCLNYFCQRLQLIGWNLVN